MDRLYWPQSLNLVMSSQPTSADFVISPSPAHSNVASSITSPHHTDTYTNSSDNFDAVTGQLGAMAVADGAFQNEEACVFPHHVHDGYGNVAVGGLFQPTVRHERTRQNSSSSHGSANSFYYFGRRLSQNSSGPSSGLGSSSTNSSESDPVEEEQQQQQQHQHQFGFALDGSSDSQSQSSTSSSSSASVPRDQLAVGHGRRLSENALVVMLDEVKDCREHARQCGYFCEDCCSEVCDECVSRYHARHAYVKIVSGRQLYHTAISYHRSIRTIMAGVKQRSDRLAVDREEAARRIRRSFGEIEEMLRVREQQLLEELSAGVHYREMVLNEKQKEYRSLLNSGERIVAGILESCVQQDADALHRYYAMARTQMDRMEAVIRSAYPIPEESVSFLPPDACLANYVKVAGVVSVEPRYPGTDCSALFGEYNNFNNGYVSPLVDAVNGYNIFNGLPGGSPMVASSPGFPAGSPVVSGPSKWSGSAVTPLPSKAHSPDSNNAQTLPFRANVANNNSVPNSPRGPSPGEHGSRGNSPRARRPFANVNLNFPVSIVTSRNYRRIRRPIFVVGREGSGPTDLCRPWGVCCDKNYIVVADRSNNRIQVYRTDGSHVRSFGQQGEAEGEFNRPAGVAIDFYYNRIVVADKDNHRIQVFTMEGEFIFAFGSRGSGNGQFHYPWDVAVNKKGMIAVTDTRNHRVQIFHSNGKFEKKFGYDNMSNVWKHFDSPRGLCFTLRDTLVVTDFNSHRIFEFDIRSNIRLVNYERWRLANLYRPQGVAIDMEGNILVADCRNNQVQVFTLNGESRGSFGVVGKELGQFDRPSDVAVTPDGKIVVVDFGNHRVQVF